MQFALVSPPEVPLVLRRETRNRKVCRCEKHMGTLQTVENALRGEHRAETSNIRSAVLRSAERDTDDSSSERRVGYYGAVCSLHFLVKWLQVLLRHFFSIPIHGRPENWPWTSLLHSALQHKEMPPRRVFVGRRKVEPNRDNSEPRFRVVV